MSETKTSRVLIVDDMRVNRMILSSLLSSHGVRSDTAEGGKECIEMFQNGDYDLILLDHRMPEIDGVDTFLHLKEIFKETGREIPVVVHTVEAGRDNINLYKAAGFADVLIKPIQPQELSDILMTYLPEGHLTSTETDDETAKINAELAKLPDWLSPVSELDLYQGVEINETADDYLDALSVFAASANEKAAEIETYFNEKNYELYTLKVHSVKSMAGLIGAAELSDLAAALETAGKHNDTAFIEEHTAKLLADYRALSDDLAPLRD